MSDPVVCSSCGESFAVYPVGGKCPKCGAAIPSGVRSEPKSIDEEILRLSEKRETCPTCGKLLPIGSKLCPSCRAPEVELPTRRGLPVWSKLLLVLAFAIIAGAIAFLYTRKWGHEQRVASVKMELEQARKAAAADKIREAVLSLESARNRLEWFEQDDPDRDVLLSEIESTRKELRATLEEKLKQMIKRDEVSDAQRFYEVEIKPIDTDRSLLDVINKAIADRNALQELRKSLKQAQKFHDEGSFAAALKEISTLRTKVQDPIKARGEAMAELRTTVEGLQTNWVKEAFNKGTALLDSGKLADAVAWFEMSRQYVWTTEVTLRRRIQESLYHISEKRVIGVTINLGPIRIVGPEGVRTDIATHLGRKLADEGFLMLAISGSNDPKASELVRLVTVNYKEEKSREFMSESGAEKATGTRITCELKVTPIQGGQVLWQERVTAETGAMGDVGRAAFNDSTLRQNAVNTFWRAFDALRIPNANLLP